MNTIVVHEILTLFWSKVRLIVTDKGRNDWSPAGSHEPDWIVFRTLYLALCLEALGLYPGIFTDADRRMLPSAISYPQRSEVVQNTTRNNILSTSEVLDRGRSASVSTPDDTRNNQYI